MREAGTLSETTPQLIRDLEARAKNSGEALDEEGTCRHQNGEISLSVGRLVVLIKAGKKKPRWGWITPKRADD